jgi:hypothetical protein
MVGQMLMVLLGIMVSQSMSLLVGGVADAGERLVESKLLEWFQSGVVPWCSDRDRLLLVCSGFDCCVFAEDGGRSGCLKGRIAMALDPVLKRLGGLLRPIFLYWARSSLTELVAIAAHQRLMARGFSSAKQWTNF